jgi:N-acetylmuramoyl-L-alanine amidase
MGQSDSQRPAIVRRPLSYAASLQHRSPETIDLVVIHCTELPDLAMAREFGERVVYEKSGTGNSGHYYLDRDGRVEEWAPCDRIAHHTRGFNERSIGIELVNNGRFPDWLDSRHQRMTEPYGPQQMQALVGLLLMLRHDLPSLRWVAGHESLDTATVASSDSPGVLVRRKRDPGPLFPWDTVMKSVELRRLQHSPPSR